MMLGKKYALGFKHSPETRERHRQGALRRWLNPEDRERARQAALGNKNSLGHRASPETREKMRQAKLGRKRSLAVREKMRMSRLRQTFPTKMTSIERLLHDEFKKRRLKFEMHKTMFRRWQPDFVFEQARLIVQADGDYWHSLPDRMESDHAFNAVASSEGWSVWRFGEREIKMHAPVCARAVARFVRDH
jgi:very-short-patch-repair endonuclease